MQLTTTWYEKQEVQLSETNLISTLLRTACVSFLDELM